MPVSSGVLFSFSPQLPEAAFPSHWVEGKIHVNMYQISWLIFLFIAGADRRSASSRHRQLGRYRTLIYWGVRRAVPLFPCTIWHRFPPHGTGVLTPHLLYLIKSSCSVRLWVCFGSFEGEGMRNNGLVWPGNCYLLPCFAEGYWEIGRTCVSQFW